MQYHHATICLNGHVISKYQSNAEKFCSKCGTETFSFCPSCKNPIRGLYNPSNIAILGDRPYDKPMFCYECGSPYPWTQLILNNAVELLSLDDSLDQASKELIKTSIPGLIIETPTTPISIAKYKKGISSAGDFLKHSLYQLLVDIASETAKKTLFPQT